MREPRGKILLETIKSQKSSQVVPSANGWKWKTLKPRAVVSARRKTPVLLELDLSQTAKMTYVLLLDRATLSQKNLWIDERGFVFVIFTICSLAEQLGRSTVSVSSALKELDAAGLIERRRTRFSSPNHIFVKIPNVE